jgi:CxxC-x17-CxxC domain-containing protein
LHIGFSRKGAELSYQDKALECRDCGQEFTWTAGEQEFYAQRGLVNQPGRCPDCRRARKAQQGGGSYAGGGYSAGGGYDRPQRQMFDTVCSECGKETQVPFQPRGDKPVYCSDCFAERRQSSGGGYGSGSYGSRDRY